MAPGLGPLHVEHRPASSPPPGGHTPVAVLVHGSLDRAASFRRVARRLPDVNLVLYDRRGYQGSRRAGVTDVSGHLDDLVRLVDSFSSAGAPLVVVGHSLGGTLALAAAVRRPAEVDAVGAYEPPLPWLGFGRQRPRGEPAPAWASDGNQDPGAEAERFFRRMVGDAAWDRLSDEARAARRADGPALVAELRTLRQGPPVDVTAVPCPVVVGRGGPASAPHHRQGTAWLAEHLADAELLELPAAAHGAHLSHPDGFARLVRRTVERGVQHNLAAPGAPGRVDAAGPAG